MIAKLLRRISAGLLSGVMIASAAVSPVSAAVVDKDNPNNYDNFAEALQLALCFYDANKCGDEWQTTAITHGVATVTSRTA